MEDDYEIDNSKLKVKTKQHSALRSKTLHKVQIHETYHYFFPLFYLIFLKEQLKWQHTTVRPAKEIVKSPISQR